MSNLGFKRVPMGEVIRIFDSKRVPLSSMERSKRQGKYPYYGAQGIIDHIDSYVFDGRYLLIPEDGENLRSRKLPIAYFAEGKFWVNNHAHIITGVPNASDDYYILYALTTTDISPWITGAAQPKLSQENLKKILIRLPSYQLQTRIAKILRNYDSLIQNNTRRIEILEQIAKLTYDEWFIKFRFPGHEKVRMVQSKLGKIPEGWYAKVFGDVAQQVRENVQIDEVNPETPYIGLEHVPRNSLALLDWGYARDVASSKLTFRRGDTLFGKIRPYFHKVAIAPIDGICSSDILVMRPVSPEYYSLVLLCASSKEFVDHAAQTAQGTKMPRANWDVLASYPIIVASAPIMSIFNEMVRNIVSLILNMVDRNRNLMNTRNLLLEKLISGDLDASKLGIQYPEVEA